MEDLEVLRKKIERARSENGLKRLGAEYSYCPTAWEIVYKHPSFPREMFQFDMRIGVNRKCRLKYTKTF